MSNHNLNTELEQAMRESFDHMFIRPDDNLYARAIKNLLPIIEQKTQQAFIQGVVNSGDVYGSWPSGSDLTLGQHAIECLATLKEESND